MGKKITQLATITEVADDDLLVGVDISDTSGSAEGTNKKFTKANLLSGLAPLDPQLTGWNPDTETWVYHSVDDPTGYIKIEDKDVSANYSVGYRIMFTNGGNVIKGIITAITYSDPDTIITFLHEIDPTDSQALHLLTNSAITENYYSPHKAPLGFPMSPAKWSVETTSTSTASNGATSNVWYNLSSLSISVPIGVWNTSYKASVQVVGATTGYQNSNVALSTSNNSVSDSKWRTFFFAHSTANTVFTHTLERLLTTTSKTTYYLIEMVDQNATSIGLLGSTGDIIITAVCAYL